MYLKTVLQAAELLHVIFPFCADPGNKEAAGGGGFVQVE